jgi:branched-chain amino acid transport system substrate-binding protein
MIKTGIGRFPSRLVAIAVISLMLAGCGSIFNQPLNPVVKIGLVAPFEGRHRDTGYDVIYSARLAIREANERSGDGQTKYALVAMDDFGDPESARQIAEAMVIDPDVMAVIGHWLPATTAAAQPVYETEGLPFIAAGEGILGSYDPANLDDDFLRAYEQVTPFDETAGPYAGSAYDGVNLILAAMATIEENGDTISRASMDRAMSDASYEGITGLVHIR